MEFPFNVNNLLGSDISIVDRSLTPFRTSPATIRTYKEQLCQVIDRMGAASAKAQALNGIITTSHKLQISDHHLYLMKDADANNGKGAVVGLLKMGHKRLFIYDNHGVHHEMEPLCALDFYIHESRQRTGCGRRLFETMMKEEDVKPHHIAIDRPSHKFLSFLQKHYHLKATIPQVNNFVVFDGYFRDKPANAILDRRKGSRKPPLHPYKRQGPGRPSGGPSGGPPGAEPDIHRLSQTSDRPPSGSLLPQTQLERERAAGVGEDTSLSRKFNSLSLLTLDDEHVDGAAFGLKDVLSAVALQRQQSQETLTGNPGHLSSRAGNHGNSNQPDSKAMGAHNSMYSRYGNPSPVPQQQSDSMTTKSIHETPERIDITKKIIGGKDPPLLKRDGPSSDYLHLLGRDAYKDRRQGAAPAQTIPKTKSSTHTIEERTSLTPGTFLQPSDGLHSSKSRSLPSTWNVFGVPPNPRTQNHSHFHTRLW